MDGTAFVLFGIAGCFGELIWTSTSTPVMSLVARLPIDWKLPARSYLWMFPIYGLGGWGFQLLHDAIAGEHWLLRGAVYTVFCFSGEYLTGWIIKRVTGTIPWDYSEDTKLQLHGLIRYDYAPLWFCVGLMTERIDQVIRAIAPVVGQTLLT